VKPGLQRLAVAVGLILLTLGYVVTHWRMTTDISEFIPGGTDRTKAQLSKSIVGSELSRTVLVSVEAKTTEAAVDASRKLEALIRADAELMAELAFVEGGPPQGVDRTLWELYEPRRFSFAAPSLEAARELVTDAGLDRTVLDLKRRLESPLSTVVTRVAPSDPLLAVPRLLEGMNPGGKALDVVSERFIADQRFAILLLGTRASAFDADAMRRVLGPLNDKFEAVNAEAGHQLKLQSSGLARFAISAEETIQGDLKRISVLSVLGMLAVCITLFRSLRLVLLPWLPIGCGMLAGTAASLALFGSVHGLTLAIGSSLIGVCIDYITHFYVHHLLGPDEESPPQTMRRIWMSLLVGGATTVTGFALLAGSSFPGLRQIATFSSVGIAAALFSTRYFIPQLMPRRGAPPLLLRRLAEHLERGLHALHRHRKLALALPLLAVILSVIGLFRVQWDDDMSRLTHFDAELHAEDTAVRARVAQFDQSRFVVALGTDDESALAVNDRLTLQLEASRKAGELGSFQGIGQLLPSAEQQQAIAGVLRSAELRPRLGSRLEQAGFNREVFEPFFSALEANPAPPLRYAELANSPAFPLVRAFRVTFGNQVGFITFLREVHDPRAIEARVEPSGAVFVDQSALMRSANTLYNRRIVELLLLGLVAVFGILWLRYRSPLITLAAFLPAVLSAGVTVFVLGALNMPLNLLGLTGLLMVLSMGVDYSVFMAESAGHAGVPVEGGELGATVLGVVVDWFTTVFGFGVLALSRHPAMQIIGVVAGVGVTSALLLAPAALAVAGRRTQGTHP
jgi:predicted exporter